MIFIPHPIFTEEAHTFLYILFCFILFLCACRRSPPPGQFVPSLVFVFATTTTDFYIFTFRRQINRRDGCTSVSVCTCVCVCESCELCCAAAMLFAEHLKHFQKFQPSVLFPMTFLTNTIHNAHPTFLMPPHRNRHNSFGPCCCYFDDLKQGWWFFSFFFFLLQYSAGSQHGKSTAMQTEHQPPRNCISAS